MTANFAEPAIQPELASASRSVRPFFWGWIILGIAAAAQFMSAPGQSYSVAAFIDPMLADLRLSRTQFSMAYGVATLLGGITLPFIGRLIDEHGPRIMLPIVALFLGFACLWMSSIHQLAALYIGFGMIRCLGQGTLTLISTWLVGEWFERRRGLAMGIVGLGGTLSVFSFPRVNQWLIDVHGWRDAWCVLAVCVWVVLILPGWWLIRNRPEEIGQLPDGATPEDSTAVDATEPVSVSQRPLPSLTHSWTMQQALRTSAFWKLICVIGTSALVGTGLVFHQVSLLGERGLSDTMALTLIGVQACISTVSSLLGGYLTDRLPSRFLLAASMSFLASAVLLVLFLPFVWLAFVYAGLLGLHGGIMRSTGAVVWVNYYGRLNQGSVRGIAMSLMIAAAALGPLPLAIAKDHLGRYDAALAGFVILPVLAALLAWRCHPPIRRTATSAVE